jgi:hypothetical protein
MSRSRTGHFIKTNTTLNGNPLRDLGAELNGVDATEQEVVTRDMSGKDASVAAGTRVDRSLSGAPLSGAAGISSRGLGRAAAPGRSLSTTGETEQEDSSAGHKALSVLKQALPVVKNLLPLLEGICWRR